MNLSCWKNTDVSVDLCDQLHFIFDTKFRDPYFKLLLLTALAFIFDGNNYNIEPMITCISKIDECVRVCVCVCVWVCVYV